MGKIVVGISKKSKVGIFLKGNFRLLEKEKTAYITSSFSAIKIWAQVCFITVRNEVVQGNVFTPVCQSFCSQVGCLPQCMLGYTHPPGRYTPLGRYTLRAGTACGQAPPRAGTPPPWAGTPPPKQVHPHPLAGNPLGRYTPQAGTPPGRYTPQAGTPPTTVTAADGTPPTGMLSCFYLE